MAERISTTDRVYAQLRESIVSGELRNDSLHSIYQMAERLGVSRTPVRDAVLRLADAGLVHIERNRGVRIRGVGVSSIRDVFESRLLIEVPAAGFAAEHADAALLLDLDTSLAASAGAAHLGDLEAFTRHDRELHDLIMLSTGNERLVALVRSLRDTTQTHGVSTFNRSRDLAAVQREHIPIVDAIRKQDVTGARRQMGNHLAATGRLLMQQVAEITAEPVPDHWPGSLIPRE